MSAASHRGLPPWAWLVIVPVAIVAILSLALALLFPPAKVKLLVTDQLHRALAREVRFADASLGLWPPVRLTVRKPELAEPGGFAQGAAVSAEALQLDLDVVALLSRKVRVRSLTIDRPALHLLLRADGTSNLDSLGAPAAPGAPPPAMDLDVRAFAVRDGRVLVDDVRAGRRIAFGITTALSLQARGDGKRVATAGKTDVTGLMFGPSRAATAAELDHGLANLVLHVEHRGAYDAPTQRLALERLALRLGRTDIVFTGVVDGVGARPRFRLRAQGTGVDFGEVLGWVAVADAPAVKGLSGSGRLAFDLNVVGGAAEAGAPPALPEVTGWLTVKGAAFRYAGAPADVKALDLSARFAPDTLSIGSLTAQVAGQPVKARLLARRFADPLVEFALQGRLDLAAVAPMVAPPGMKIGGRADVDVRGSGRAKDPGTLALEGRADLHDVSAASKELPSPVEGINGAVLFSGRGAEARGITAKAGKSSFTLDATITRPLALMAKPDSVPPAGVTFDFRSPYLDLAELLPTTPGAPFLPNAKGSGKVAIDRLLQGKLDVRQVRADVALSPAALSSPAFSLQGYGGTVSGRASFDLRDTRKPVYSVNATVANVQANDILTAWTPAKNLLRGTLSTNLDFSGAGASPEDVKRTLTLVGLASLAEGQLGPGPALDAVAQYVKVPRLREVKFRELKLPVRIEQGRVVTDAVHLTGASGDWTLAGAVGFDGALDYAVSVTLPKDVAAAIDARSALAAGALSDDQGRILLDLRVSGSAKAPRVAWDTQAMRSRLAGRASQAITEQRTKLEAQARTAAQDALSRRLGLAADSTRGASPSQQLQAARDSLRGAAGGLLQGFFSRKSAPDTTRR
jgi:AsmA protein